MMKIGIQVHMDNRCWENKNGKVSKKQKQKKKSAEGCMLCLERVLWFSTKKLS